MAQLVVRNLDETVKVQLAMFAKMNGQSMEEEVRQILSRFVRNKSEGIGTTISSYFDGIGLEGRLPEIECQELRNPFEEQ